MSVFKIVRLVTFDSYSDGIRCGGECGGRGGGRGGGGGESGRCGGGEGGEGGVLDAGVSVFLVREEMEGHRRVRDVVDWTMVRS